MNPKQTEKLFEFVGKVEARLDSGDDKFDEIDKRLMDMQGIMTDHGETLAVLKDRSEDSRKVARKSGAGAGGIFGLISGFIGNLLGGLFKG